MYMIYDLETQTSTYLKRKASPWHPDNYIVAAGWKIQGDKECSYDYNDKPCKYHLHIPEHVTLLVGHNLKFDLLWQWDNPELHAFFKRGGRIWCTQYAEYLIHGQAQNYHYAELDKTAPKYGGTNKIDEIKILWEAGVQTSDIDKGLLIDYLVGTREENRDGGDIGNTEKVFLGQIKKVIELDMLKAVQSRMEGLCATTEMEWNGLYIDLPEAAKQFRELSVEKAEAYEELNSYIPELPDELEFNWGSVVHKSCLIFGGHIKYVKKANYIDEKTGELARFRTNFPYYLLDDGSVSDIRADEHEPPENVARFAGGKRKGEAKTKKVAGWGELKERNTDFFFKMEGFTKPLPEWEGSLKDGLKNPVYSTNGDVIELIAKSGVPFCETLGRYTALNKEIGTYFLATDKHGKRTGMLTCVDKEASVVHHSLNNVSTVTGRLSSSDPNLQNIPRGDKSKIKKVFCSRFGDDGVMIEADYSQLEVVVQGVLTGDPQLCKDLRDRIDFHCKRVALAHHITYEEAVARCKNPEHPEYDYWNLERTRKKGFSFQRAYGAGAAAIAIATGMNVEEVKKLIETEEITYAGIPAFNAAVKAEVESTAKPFKDSSEGYKVYRRGNWQSPTGCLYSFRSFEAMDFMKERGELDSFSPPQMKNYPVQGTGGEIVQGICGRLWRRFVETNNYDGKAYLCNTVHDCVWIDCHKDVVKQVAEEIKIIMEAVPEWFEQFGVEVNVPFPVDVEAGPNMLELHHV